MLHRCFHASLWQRWWPRHRPHPNKPGATLRQRIRWTPLADDAVRQLWQSSDDDGATWKTAFDGRYVRASP